LSSFQLEHYFGRGTDFFADPGLLFILGRINSKLFFFLGFPFYPPFFFYLGIPAFSLFLNSIAIGSSFPKRGIELSWKPSCSVNLTFLS